MYRRPDYEQSDIYDFILPFGGHLNQDNRWVVLRNSIDWKVIHEIYEENFDNKKTGNEALSAEIAFGALYIQRKLSLTDRELVDQISENPYMQYFIGFKEFRAERPFDPSLLVAFRKRINGKMILTFRITDQDVIVRRKCQKYNEHLRIEGFPTSGHA